MFEKWLEVEKFVFSPKKIKNWQKHLFCLKHLYVNPTSKYSVINQERPNLSPQTLIEGGFILYVPWAYKGFNYGGWRLGH